MHIIAKGRTVQRGYGIVQPATIGKTAVEWQIKHKPALHIRRIQLLHNRVGQPGRIVLDDGGRVVYRRRRGIVLGTSDGKKEYGQACSEKSSNQSGKIH